MTKMAKGRVVEQHDVHQLLPYQAVTGIGGAMLASHSNHFATLSA